MASAAAAALAVDRDLVAAAGRAVEEAIGGLGGAAAHTVVVFTTATYDDPRPVVAAARKAARGARVVGCATAGVLANAREHEDGPAVACLALAGDQLEPFLTGTPASLARPASEQGLGVVFADGYSHHPTDLADGLAAAIPGYSLAGGLAAGPDGVYPAHRWLDSEISATGLAGLLVPSETAAVAVTQGCRPLGRVHHVTVARGQVIASLDGRPAFEVFAERARPLLDDLPRAAQTLFLAVPETDDDADPIEEGYAIRGLLRFDPERGLLAVSEPIPEGTRVRFAARDPAAAREDLCRTVAALARRCGGRPPRMGFYFCCAGRGRNLFGIEGHDSAYIHAHLGKFPMVGFFGGGEIGPGRASARLHLFSGVLALVP